MAMIVEDGTGLASSNSYTDEKTFFNYAADRGYVLTAGDQSAALVRATQWIDSTYRARFQGWRLKFRAQALEWPRAGVADASGFVVSYTTVPFEIVYATCEAAMRELASPGSLSPDTDQLGRVKMVKAGDSQITYGAYADNGLTNFRVIDGLLGTLLVGPTYSARAVRV